MNASSESGECARAIVCFSTVVVILELRESYDGRGPFDSIVNSIALDGLESGFFDQADQFRLCHLHFVVRLERITLGQLAAFGDRAVDIVGAEVQRDLSQPFAE